MGKKEMVLGEETKKDLNLYQEAFNILNHWGENRRRAFFGPVYDSWQYRRVVEFVGAKKDKLDNNTSLRVIISVNNPEKDLKTPEFESIFLKIINKVDSFSRRVSLTKHLIKLEPGGGCFFLNNKGKEENAVSDEEKLIITDIIREVKNNLLELDSFSDGEKVCPTES
jgi:hypothetical protein